MAPAKPNAFWVKKWLKDHDIDALLADAVNKVRAAEQPGDGTHANCEQTALHQHLLPFAPASHCTVPGRDHGGIDLPLTNEDANLQAVQTRSNDPAATLSYFFQKKS